MTAFVRFALLGLGVGALYALVGEGLVLVYRGTGVLSFAQGAFAAAGAYQLYDLTQNDHWSIVPSVMVVLVELAVFGALVHVVIMRRLSSSAPLVKLIASLGLFIALDQVIAIRYGTDALVMPPFLPQGGVTVLPGVKVGADRFIIAGIAVAVSILLSLWLRTARSGLAVEATAEDPTAAASLGWSPLRLGAITWALGAMLAGGAGMLIGPISGLDPTTASLIVVPAMAAALVGAFRSFWLTLLGGVIIGVGESLTSYYVTTPGWTNSVPFLVIVVTLMVRGRSLPQRGDLLERLPRLGTGQLRLPVVLALAAAGVVLVGWMMPPIWADGASTTLQFALVLASLVVVTGYAGQLSLVQFWLAGLGALVAAKLVIAGVPYEIAIPLAGVCMIPIGLIVGVVALRTRGASLAIATLALGLIIQGLVLQSASLTGGLNGLKTGEITLFGASFYSATHPGRYAAVLLVVLVVVLVGVANLRRSAIGIRLVAVRDNERAAAALGINVFGGKLYAFSSAAAIAGFAGAFFAFRTSLLSFDAFNASTAISLIALVVIGGIGFAVGPLVGSTLAAGGLAAVAASEWFGADVSKALLLASGVSMILLVMNNPDGVGAAAGARIAKLLVRPAPFVPGQASVGGHDASRAGSESAGTDGGSGSPARRGLTDSHPSMRPVIPRALRVERLVVSFGQVRALDELTLDVDPGTVVGLIGPNGAGKTTLIDAVSGFVAPSAGHVSLGDEYLDSLSPERRAGRGLGRTFQGSELFGDLTVRENLLVASSTPSLADWCAAWVHPGDRRLPARAEIVVEMLSLRSELDLLPDEVSLAKRRLAAVARAVVRWPSVLLLDEPAAGLTSTEAQMLGDTIRELAREWGFGVLLVEHDVAMVMRCCELITAVDFGRSIAHGPPSHVRTHPEVRRAYLGVDDGAVSEGAVR